MSSASDRPSRSPGREAAPLAARPPRARWWQRLLPWLITAGCFLYLYGRLDRAASAQGQALGPYLADVFAHVSWARWLALMIPYCALFVLIDSAVVWRVVGWFNAKLRYADVLPIRASPRAARWASRSHWWGSSGASVATITMIDPDPGSARPRPSSAASAAA